MVSRDKLKQACRLLIRASSFEHTSYTVCINYTAESDILEFKLFFNVTYTVRLQMNICLQHLTMKQITKAVKTAWYIMDKLQDGCSLLDIKSELPMVRGNVFVDISKLTADSSKKEERT